MSFDELQAVRTNEADAAHLARALAGSLKGMRTVERQGRVAEVLGTVVRVVGLELRIGELCDLRLHGQRVMQAEVMGFDRRSALLLPFGELGGLSSETLVTPTRLPHQAPTGDGLRGRVLDGLGRPIDGRGPLVGIGYVPVESVPPGPLQRRPIRRPFVTGVRAIDTLMTCGEGQRMGVFASPGVGKTTLIGMLARHARADVNVIALVGERGREVGEFISATLSSDVLARSVLVVSTSDRPAVERAKSASVATAIAESFRRRGLRVMLVLDSLTRYARALREIGLAAGEPPVRRGFPPSTFAALPRLLERAGNDGVGTMTAFYTVLTEGLVEDDPIADEARAILDGHIVLSRELAEAQRFPAIDVVGSLSRSMSGIVHPSHRMAAAQVRRWLAKHGDIELLLQVGDYQHNQDPEADAAVRAMPAIRRLLEQPPEQQVAFEASLGALRGLVEASRA